MDLFALLCTGSIIFIAGLVIGVLLFIGLLIWAVDDFPRRIEDAVKSEISH